jgi:hypothetical protein
MLPSNEIDMYMISYMPLSNEYDMYTILLMPQSKILMSFT